jgi:acetate kinase
VRILTVNAGSTSLKLSEVIDGRSTRSPTSLEEAFDAAPPDVVAHRVVHGGDRTAAEVVDDVALAELRALTDLAPLHQPPALNALERCRAVWPDVPNVACFDTAFHTTIPAAARTYALPERHRHTVRVYGFHGLSYAWSAKRIAVLAPEARRVIVAHLGGGQSLCAVLHGRSVMTTMGFTPLDGLVMATRPGSLDPGALLWLSQHSTEDLSTVLDEQSGLLGLCGTGDMRIIHERVAAGDDQARLAFEVWRHRIVTQLGGCVATLGGLDTLVFTGGIGEHNHIARAAVADGFQWLGVALDEGKEAADEDVAERELTAPQATVRTFVVPAREDLQLAAEAAELFAAAT